MYMDTKALFKLGYGLYVIGTEHEGVLAGCTCNTVAQITGTPVQIAVGLNKDNYTNEMIHKSGKLTVSILDKTADMDLIANFGFQSSRTADKFHTSGQAFVVDTQAVPYLAEHTSAVLSAKVVIDPQPDLFCMGQHGILAASGAEHRLQLPDWPADRIPEGAGSAEAG